MASPDPIRGWCLCGCGQRTNVKANGVPRRYLMGHHKRKIGFIPYRATRINGRFVFLHRLRAEKALGKPLPPQAIVHHADGSQHEDAPLVICQDSAYHKLLHYRMRVKAAGGDPKTQKVCSRCQAPKNFSEFYKSAGCTYGLGHRCKACHGAMRANRRRGDY